MEKLVRRAQGGDRKSVELLLEQHGGRLFALAFHFLGNREEAQEAAQEALVRIFTRLESLRDPSGFAAWSATITANLCRDRLRARRPKNLPMDQVAEPAGGCEPETEALRSESARMVRQAIDSLSPLLRRVVILRDVEGFSYEEVGAALEIPVGTVKSRLFEARRRLKSLLERSVSCP